MKTKLNWLWALLLIIPLVTLTCAPAAEVAPPAAEQKPAGKVVEYTIPCMGDWTGPYAPVVQLAVWGNKATLDWWNENVGKGIGVKLTPKWYDSRYDTATVSSMWPSILTELKPICVLGLGGSDVAALKKRLPDDQVPMLMSTASYGFDWVEGMQWVIQLRPTYAHEGQAAFDWMVGQWPEKDLPIKWTTLVSDVAPAYKDITEIYKLSSKLDQYKGKLEYMGPCWIALVPTDITNDLKPFIDGGVDIIQCFTNTAQGVAAIRASSALQGKPTPMMFSTHNCLATIAGVVGWDKLEDSMEVSGLCSQLNYEAPIYKQVWANYHDPKADVKEDWNLVTVQFAAQALILGKAVEQAVSSVGAEHLTGKAIRDAILNMDLNEAETMGVMRGAKWAMDSPFPVVDHLGVQINKVKNGINMLATPTWVPVPQVPKPYQK